jgi:hypothetical protein
MFFFISGFLFTRMPPTDGQEPTFGEFMEAVKKTWLFARTPKGSPATAREKENAVHRRCAWVILVSLVLAAATSQLRGVVPWFAIFEATAIFGFAVSWLTKNKRESNVAKVVLEDVKLLVAKATGSTS